MNQKIEIKCKAADTLPIDAMEPFQGELKTLSKKAEKQVIDSILKYGFSAPFFCWNGSGHNYILDGHQRHKALCAMREQGYDLPMFPVVYIDALDETEAKQKLLRLNSQYGQMTIESVLEFTEGIEIDFEELQLPGGIIQFDSESKEFIQPDGTSTRELDTDEMSMLHKCPRCGMEFDK
jgi:hypothetical protein